MSSTQKVAIASLDETSQKVKASLSAAIESSVTSDEFSKKDMLDFLEVKNSLMMSYIIDLTLYLRNKNEGVSTDKNLRRLTEMKTVLDKMRGLDKKLRYQIEKLLNASTTASAFATGGDNFGPEDPLQFKPNPDSLLEDGEPSGDHSGDESDADFDDDDNDQSDPDDDLKAARATLSMAKEQKSRKNDEADDGIYHAPRLAAVPYTHDLENKQKEKEKRAKRRLRATELAQTLRAEYGEAPEQEDMHGGSDYGKQRAAARRLAEREAEKTKAEEEGMVRLITSRKEKKEKKRLLRMESSNLGAISDLSNLVRETREFGRDDRSDDDNSLPPIPKGGAGNSSERYHNGKRSRGNDMADGKSAKRHGKMGKPKNALQSALFDTRSSSKQKRSKRR